MEHGWREEERDDVGFAEMQNPGLTAEVERRREHPHPFEGDEHGHDRHDTIPTTEESAEDELRPSEAHNPRVDER